MTERAAHTPGPQSRYELDERSKDFKWMPWLGGDPAGHEVFDPLPQQRIAKPGAWVMITRKLPPMEGGLDQHIRVARVFWAEHEATADDAGFLPGGKYKIKLNSPWGSLSLWPYEYSRIEAPRLIELWQSGELIFHALDMEQAAFDEVVFYARSRGIRLADAAVMALGSLSGRVGWFEPVPDLAAQAEALEHEMHLPMSEHHKRRMATRSRSRAAIRKAGRE